MQEGYFLENLVYLEMLSRGYEVYVGETYNGEIDFVAVKDGKKCFIQVAYLLASEETVRREFGAYGSVRDRPYPHRKYQGDNLLTMKLTAEHSDMTMSEPIVVLNRDDCLKMGVGPNDRVRITGSDTVVSAVIVSDTLVPKGTIGVSDFISGRCGASPGDALDVIYSPMPESVRSIRSKIDGNILSREEIGSIVWDIQDGNLSANEIIAFVSAFNKNNASMDEIAMLAQSMASTGRTIDLGTDRVFDFHSLGGVPGNKITPIVVSIVASEGIVIPKLSSRAVSSACGTADYVDTFCDVEMSSDELKDAIRRAGGVFACGNQDYAPVGSIIIGAERPMGIDPRPMMIASIMSKKIAIGTTDLVVDIPSGEGSKISDMRIAREYARDLIKIGKILGMNVECAVTDAEEPIGRMIGPILEAKECIEILENGDGDVTVVDKACSIAGMILEMAGMIDGKSIAMADLRSGKAYEKFLEIMRIQNGDPDLRSSDLIPGRYVKDVHAKYSGYLQYIDNRNMVAIAKGAGAPCDTGAGIEIMHKKGDLVKEGDVLFRIYAENKAKLERAVESARSRRPMLVKDETVSRKEEMIIERIR